MDLGSSLFALYAPSGVIRMCQTLKPYTVKPSGFFKTMNQNEKYQ